MADLIEIELCGGAVGELKAARESWPARYYANRITVWCYGDGEARYYDKPTCKWRKANNVEEYTNHHARMLSATDDESAIREAWPEPVPKPAPATDPAREWAETNVTRKKTAFPEWLHVEAGFASLYLTVPARGCGSDIGDLRRLVAAIFRAGQAHERARVEGLLTAPHDIGDGYPHGQLMDDIRSGRDLRGEAKS